MWLILISRKAALRIVVGHAILVHEKRSGAG